MTPQEKVEARQRLRYEILAAIHAATDGQINRHVAKTELNGIDKHDWESVREALIYLSQERLIVLMSGYHVGITHEGIVEYEATLAAPKESTAHFAATTIMHFNAPVGAVQSGANATANVEQALAEGVVAVLSLQELRGALREEPHDRQVTVAEFVDAIEVLLHQKPLRRLPLRLLIDALVVQLTADAARNAAVALQHITLTHAAND